MSDPDHPAAGAVSLTRRAFLLALGGGGVGGSGCRRKPDRSPAPQALPSTILDPRTAAGVALDARGHATASMGVGVCDYRHEGRQTSCLSNMRQIGLAVYQYTEDNDELLPNRKNEGGHLNWKTYINPYVKSTQVWVCPSDPYKGLDDDGSGFPAGYAANTDSGNGNPLVQPFIDCDGWAGFACPNSASLPAFWPDVTEAASLHSPIPAP